MRHILDPFGRWIGPPGRTRAGTGGGPPPPFSPSDDTALIAWYDAADAATITDAGGAVSGVADKAGTADLIQGSGAEKPTTGTRTLNGLNVLDFDGGDNLTTTLAVPASGNVAFHAALVIDATSNAFEALLSVNAAVNDFQIDANNASQFDGRLQPAGIGSSTPLTGGPFSGALILSAVFDRTGAAQAQVFIADTSRGTMAYTAAIDPSVTLGVMTNRSKNASVDGALAELIVTGNTANRTSHHAYLTAKWGL